MKTNLYQNFVFGFTIAFILSGYLSAAQPVKYGAFTVKPDIDSRLLASNNLGVDYIRETQLLSHWDGVKNLNIDYWGTRKKKLVLNINNDSTPSAFPTNIAAYKTKLQSFVDVYADSIELAVIENEELNRYGDAVGELYHLGSMQDYINELNAAVNICRKKYIPVTNGGLTTPIVASLKHYYEINNKQDSVSWLVQQMGGVASDSLLWKRTDSLLNAFKTIPLNYINLHWYEPMKGMTGITGVLPVLCNYITQQTSKKVITNETGIKTDSTIVTKLMQQWDIIKPAFCLFFDGVGSNGGQPLTSTSGSLLKTGIAFRNFVAGGNACSRSIIISPAGFIDACNGDSMILTASQGFSNYQWNTGNTTRSILVKATGNYSVISHQNNCISFSNSAQIFMNSLPEKPVITTNPSPALNVCQNKNVQLLASNALTHLWSTGETTKNIFVSSPGKYAVTISDINGCKNTSDSITVTYQNCSAPSRLSVSGITTTKASLNWDTVPCAIGYQVQYRIKGILPWSTFQVLSGITSSRTIYSLLPGIYEWRMLTYCRYSPDTVKSIYVKGPDFTIISALQIVNATTGSINDLDIKIFPVPAKNIVTISLSHTNNDLKILLTDVYGKILWQNEKVTGSTIRLPVAGLASSIYTVIVEDKAYKKILRLIKE